ncbi:citrate carrier, mitochondrial [Pelomyxa schiedti]|nr:citrate carrier, mitochondrial [Pelomyxa schiedti]
MASRKHALSSVILAAIGSGLSDGTLTYPVEALKLRLQIARKQAVGGKKESPTMRSITRDVIANEGVRGIYRGIGFHLIGEVLKSCWRFALYESVKKEFFHLTGKNPNKLTVADNILISSISSVGETIFCVQPWERLKLMSLAGAKPIEEMKKVYREEGVLACTHSLYKGLDMTLVRQWGNSVCGFTMFYWLKSFTLRNNPQRQLSNTEKFIYGGVSGSLGALITMPFDSVKSIKQKDIKRRGPTSRQYFAELYKQNGLLGFYRGSTPRLALLFLKRGIAFHSYETILEQVEKFKH